MAASLHSTLPRSPGLPGLLLGFALGGFFDGILLHQVLQWHHLLSGVRGEALRDLRMQVLADGLFHVLMYLVAMVGLAVLWRRRGALVAPEAGRRLLAAALAGFGGWHVVDTVLSHWLTGIHRIRMDVPDPLPWDIGWLVVFGLLPLALAAWLRRPPSAGAAGRGGIAAVLALVVVGAGVLAARPPAGSEDVLVVFRPGIAPAQALQALGRLDARVVWADRSGTVWAAKLQPEASASTLYRDGALLVSRSAVALGCLSWSAAQRASP